MFETRNLLNLHFPDNTFQGRICLKREVSHFLGPDTQRVTLNNQKNAFIFLLYFNTRTKLRITFQQENVKHRLFGTLAPFIFILYTFIFNFKVKNNSNIHTNLKNQFVMIQKVTNLKVKSFVAGVCLANKSLSAFGGRL